MEFLQSTAFIVHSTVYCLIFCLCLVPIGLTNPRMMLQDYPKEIIDLVPPKTQAERKQGIYFAVPLVMVMVGYPAFISWMYTSSPDFLIYFLVMWSLMLIMNLFDLIVLDWIMFCAITPGFVVLKGSEESPGYKNYLFHFIGFLKGIVITGVISAVTALVMFLVAR